MQNSDSDSTTIDLSDSSTSSTNLANELVYDCHGRVREPTYFMDNERIVDLVLAYEEPTTRERSVSSKKTEKLMAKYRKNFERALREAGFDLELETADLTHEGKRKRTCFLKIHAPWMVIAQVAEYMRVKVPIALIDAGAWNDALSQMTLRKTVCADTCCRIPDAVLPSQPFYFKMPFDSRRLNMFLINGHLAAVPPVERIRLVWSLVRQLKVARLKTKRNASREKLREQSGLKKGLILIEWLIQRQVYTAVFPLHDSDYAYPFGESPYYRVPPKKLPQRYWLYKYWASLRALRFFQPLEEIRSYFGVHCAFYFAWLGMYTKWLVFPTLFGLLVTVCGSWSLRHNDVLFHTFCNYEHPDVVCRLCRSTMCAFKHIWQECQYAQLSAILGHMSVTIYAAVICLWGTLFVAMWKRRQTQLAVRWDACDHEHHREVPRASFLQQVHKLRRNSFTGKEDLRLPVFERYRRLTISAVSVFFYVLIVLAFLTAVQAYRVLSASLYRRTAVFNWDKLGLDLALMTSLIASILTAVTIFILSYVYKKAAIILTNFECPRTDDDYLNSYLYKVFAFEFMNNYGAIFYLAILKGKFSDSMVSVPEAADFCPISGCMTQATIQLLSIFTIKQLFNNVLEVGVPFLKRRWRMFRNLQTEDNASTRAAKDYLLLPVSTPALFEDYLEMVIQYGFIVMFAVAFPLGPLCAFLNNVIEIRVDANKLITEHRRHIPQRVKNIGPWLQILELLNTLAIFTNALIIAFTSDQIDKLAYKFTLPVITKYKEFGFLAHSLVEYNITDVYGFREQDLLFNPMNKSTCIYRGYFYDYDYPTGIAYSRTPAWYTVMVGRLAFIITFQNILMFISFLIKMRFPKMTANVKHHILREQVVAQETKAKYERNSLPQSV